MIALIYFIVVLVLGSFTAAFLRENATEYKLTKGNFNKWEDKSTRDNPSMDNIVGITLLISILWPISIPVILLYKLGKKLFNKKSPQQNTKQI